MSTEATNQQDVDVETIPFDELERLALEDAMREDDAPVTPEAAQPETTAKPVMNFRREIDLGDGAGKQVFESETAEGLIDALAQAQTHATKKIRELAREVKVEKKTEEAAERDLTADEEWLLSQELLNHPSKTLKKIVESLLKRPVEDFNKKLDRVEEIDVEARAAQAGKEFVTKHAADFYPCPANHTRIVAYMDTFKLEPTVENLEKAFADLNKSGLLEVRPTKADENGAGEAANEQEARIANTPTTPAPTQRRGGSGLSARGRTTAPIKSATPTEKELYDMPLEELERLANEQLRSGA